MTPTKLLTEQDVETLYGFKKKTLQRHRVRGKGFPFVKVEGRIYYRLNDIETYLQKNTLKSTSAESSTST